MIVVSVHTLDNSAGGAPYNGAYGIMFYALNEAMMFAQTESLQLESGAATSMSWTRVYNDGVKIAEYVDGSLL